MIPLNTILCGDCLDLMKEIPDKSIDLVITDPPYGLGDRLSDGGGKFNDTPMANLYRETEWEDVAPSKDLINELFRISKDQIICGGNYFDLPPTRCFLVWDKQNYLPKMSQCEFIWTSFDKPAKIFSYPSTDLMRFHPTQKPVKLFEWIIKNYAKEGDTICDPFFGSGSSLVAAVRMGHPFIGFEKEQSYFDAAQIRINNAKAQGKISAWF